MQAHPTSAQSGEGCYRHRLILHLNVQIHRLFRGARRLSSTIFWAALLNFLLPLGGLSSSSLFLHNLCGNLVGNSGIFRRKVLALSRPCQRWSASYWNHAPLLIISSWWPYPKSLLPGDALTVHDVENAS